MRMLSYIKVYVFECYEYMKVKKIQRDLEYMKTAEEQNKNNSTTGRENNLKVKIFIKTKIPIQASLSNSTFKSYRQPECVH